MVLLHLLLFWKVFFRKPTFNGLYTPFGSPVSGGQKPSLPLRKAPSFSPSLSSLRSEGVTALLGTRSRFALRLADSFCSQVSTSPFLMPWWVSSCFLWRWFCQGSSCLTQGERMRRIRTRWWRRSRSE